MKRVALTLALAVVAIAAVGSLQAGEATTLTGAFLWNNEDQTGDLEAIFTPTGEGTWDVSFHFDWEDKPRIFAGTAEGSLTDGELKGEVTTDGERKATFIFEGAFSDGKFEGTHASMRQGERHDTGTFTLSR